MTSSWRDLERSVAALEGGAGADPVAARAARLSELRPHLDAMAENLRAAGVVEPSADEAQARADAADVMVAEARDRLVEAVAVDELPDHALVGRVRDARVAGLHRLVAGLHLDAAVGREVDRFTSGA